MKTIHIVHLYPKEMNIYGDNGNLLVLKQRLEWRGYSVMIHRVGVGDSFPKEVHLILGGGGQDKGQSDIADDLSKKAALLKSYADQGVPMLMICGMYQMFGHYFKTTEGEKIQGIGILDVHTVAGTSRIIGNIMVEADELGKLIGYENHSGRTYLGKTVKPIGATKIGQGNNAEDNTEGAVYNNVYGSYLHGPILAKSSKFADFLLRKALKYAGVEPELEPLDDSLEYLSASVAERRPR
ncbi:MAG: glutamine amidotransferase [Candidatus Saccharimonadales bacterium]